MPTTTALGVAKIIGRSERAVDAYKDKDTYVIKKDLALGDWGADLIAGLGVVPVAPSAPQNVVATVSSPTDVRVAFDLPLGDGGAQIQEYRVVADKEGIAATGFGSPILVKAAYGANTPYRFVVFAINDFGTSLSSPLSNTVTPNPP